MAIKTEITPGSVIGILGDGQLGKMSAQAATEMGYRALVWGQSKDAPAMQVATHRIIAPFDYPKGFTKMWEIADVITTEWENVPVTLLRYFEEVEKLVCPSASILEIAQSRREEKIFAEKIGACPVPHVFIEGVNSFKTHTRESWESYLPGILKADRNGYDGKSQRLVKNYDELNYVVEELGSPCVLEKRIDLAVEISVLVAQNYKQTVVSPAVVNSHENGILRHTCWYPKMISERLERKAKDIVQEAAFELKLCGVLVIEFFVGTDGNLYFNEMAPRPHNSFHASIEAANISQFELHVRAICNLPLIQDMSFHHAFEMTNLIGGTFADWRGYLHLPGAHLHVYGKKESKNGRKMGHLTRLIE